VSELKHKAPCVLWLSPGFQSHIMIASHCFWVAFSPCFAGGLLVVTEFWVLPTMQPKHMTFAQIGSHLLEVKQPAGSWPLQLFPHPVTSVIDFSTLRKRR
jgi:hypothetical protein